MMLVMIGILLVVAGTVGYEISDFDLFIYITMAGMIITIIGVIQYGREMGYFKFKSTEGRKNPDGVV